MLQQQQLILSRLHVDKVNDDHAANVAQLKLAGNLGGGFTVGPQHGLAGIGGTCKGAGVHINHRQGFSGLNDHVTARGQIHPWQEGLVNCRLNAEGLQQLLRAGKGVHRNGVLFCAKEGSDPLHHLGTVHHNLVQLWSAVVP